MKSTLKKLAVCFALNTVICITAADCQPNITNSPWLKLSEDTALSLTLSDHSIIVKIKNTSNTLKELLSQGPELFVRLFYIDDNGAQIPLGYDDRADDIIQKNRSCVKIPPDGVNSTAINITPGELVLIKTHPVVCGVLIYDPATKQKYPIKSSPKILTETVSATPAPK